MNTRLLSIILPGILLSLPVAAQKKKNVPQPQDTIIKGATIEIIQSYKPEVIQAPRPQPVPALPPVDTDIPAMQYTVPQQTLFFSYGSLPIRPLALDIHQREEQYANYVKLGGGSLSTIYLDAGIGSLKGKDYETSIRASHLSQKGNMANQVISLTGVDAVGSLRKKGKVFGATLGVHNNRYHAFGYDNTLLSYTAANVRQAYTTVDAGVDMKNDPSEGGKWHYQPSVKYYSFAESKTGNAENSADIYIPVSYDIDSNIEIYASARFNIISYQGLSNNMYQLAPGIRFRTGIFSGHAGVSPTIGSNSNLYILPDIELAFALPETQLHFNVGWQGKLVQNSYRQLATQNPYMFPAYTQLQTTTSEVFAGIQSNIGNHISFNGRVSLWQYRDLPVFINDTVGDMKNFVLLHDVKVMALGLQAGIRYHIAQVFSLGFSGQWLNFVDKTFTEVWHTPGVRFTGDVMAQPIKKLSVSGYVSFTDRVYALQAGNKTVKLNSALDIGVGAEYEIVKRINVFLQANNLLNSRYQLWQGYDAFGFNVFGGVRLKF